MKFLSKTIATSLLLVVFTIPALASGVSPAKAKAWTTRNLHQQLDTMPAGNAQQGEQLHHAHFCASCHGQQGEAPTSNWPSLSGQRVEYTYKMLLDYQSGLRSEDARSEIMTLAVQKLSKQDMADLARFYADQTAPMARRQLNENVLKLIKHGDPARLITPCASCHGVDGQGGKNESPAIAGQTRSYFIRTMKLYHNNHRNNDNDYAMRAFAMPLSDSEINQLADYFSAE